MFQPYYLIRNIFFIVLFLSNILYAQSLNPAEILNNPESPQFAKMAMDSYPNYYKITEEYEKYAKLHPRRKETELLGREEDDIWKLWYKRWQIAVSTFVRSDGSIGRPTDADFIQHFSEAQKKIKQNKGKGSAVEPLSAVWSVVGPLYNVDQNSNPVNYSINVYGVHFNSANPLIGYCSTEVGTLFKTTDGGENWSLISKGMYVGASRGIFSLPSNPDIVYVAAGDWYGSSLYKSTDGGVTFSIIYNFGFTNAAYVWCMLLNPLKETSILIGNNTGIYRSTNGGASFTLTLTGQISGIEYKPGDTSIVYAICTRNEPISGTANYLPRFYKSTNGGATFTVKSTGWITYSATETHSIATGDISVSAANSNVVYALVVGSRTNFGTGSIGVLVSSDAGETWRIKQGNYGGTNLMTFGPSPTFAGAYCQFFYNNWLVANPANAAEIMVGGLTTYKSIDSGATHTPILGYSGIWGHHPDCQNFFTQGNTLWICNDGGILKTTDFCTTAPSPKSNGLFTQNFWHIGVGRNAEIITGGRYHNGNAVSFAPNYPTGTFLGLGGAESPTGYVNNIDSIVYHSDIGTRKIGTAISEVTSLPYISKYPTESYTDPYMSDIVFHPNYKGVFYLGNGPVLWKTTDNGQTFTSLKTFTYNVLDIELPDRGTDTLYLTEGTSNKIWRTFNLDNGASFTNITGTLPAGEKKLSVNPVRANEIYATIWNTDKVYKSTNAGATWVNIGSAGNLTGKQIRDIVVTADLSNPTVYVITLNNGMFYYSASSGVWTQLNLNLPSYGQPKKFTPYYRGDKFFAGYFNLGFWQHDFVHTQSPFANILVDKSLLECTNDTVRFYDNSILNYNGASYVWSFPGASWVSSTTARNPKVLYPGIGDYNVTLTVTNNLGVSDTRTINNMVRVVGNVCVTDSLAGKAFTSFSGGVVTKDVPIGRVPFAGNNFTIMLWIKPNGNQSAFSQMVMFDGDGDNRFGFGFAFNGYTPNLIPASCNNVHWWDASNFVLDSLVWNHVAITYSPTDLKIYKNGGTPWSSNTTYPPVDFSNVNFYINRDATTSGQGTNLKAEMDDIAFYNYTLTQDEIKQKMHLTKKITEPGLLKYIQFNQYGPLSSTLYDASGNNLGMVSNSNIIKSNAPIGPGLVDKISNSPYAQMSNFVSKK